MYFCNIFLLVFLSTILVVNGKKHTVTVGHGMYYKPRCLKIEKGDTVQFKWEFGPGQAKFPHTVTESESFQYRCDNKENGFHSGVKYSGYTWERTFDFEDESEELTYHCRTTGDSCTNCAGGMWGQIVLDEKHCKSDEEAKGTGKKSQFKPTMPKASDTDGATGYMRGF